MGMEMVPVQWDGLVSLRVRVCACVQLEVGNFVGPLNVTESRTHFGAW